MMDSRRKFLRDIGCAGIGVISAPNISFGAAETKSAKTLEPCEKDPILIGVVGCGLMGGANMREMKLINQHIVSYCDVDTGSYGFGNAKKYVDKDAPGFVDYREMFDKMKGKMDAVIIATPDHSHFSIAMSAIDHGYPIYLEKPMCHSVAQIRTLNDFAAKKSVKTQMGNMVHSADGIRYAREWIKAGLIGTVKEVLIWTCRPLSGCNRPAASYKAWPSEPVPPTLDWDKWLNTAEYGPYSSEIVPLNWRRVYKYGSGSLGDIGTHMIDVPMFALDLDYPSRITSRQRGGTEISVPKQDEVAFYFDNSNQGSKVKITWYSGFLKPDADGKYPADYDVSFLPPLPKEFTDTGRTYKDLSTLDGMFIIGTEGVLYAPKMHLMGKPIVLPKNKKDEADAIAQTEPRIKFGNHRMNFVEAVRGDVKKAVSDFSEIAKLTEVVQLGNVSLRANEDVVWDAKAMKCIGAKRANEFVSEPMRPGWY